MKSGRLASLSRSRLFFFREGFDYGVAEPDGPVAIIEFYLVFVTEWASKKDVIPVKVDNVQPMADFEVADGEFRPGFIRSRGPTTLGCQTYVQRLCLSEMVHLGSSSEVGGDGVKLRPGVPACVRV